jgi:hypothetical protein
VISKPRRLVRSHVEVSSGPRLLTYSLLTWLLNSPGNSTELCGGSQALSLYDTTGPGSLPPTAGFASNYIGCFNSDVLTGYSAVTTTMSGPACQVMCAARGFTVSGTSAGSESGYLDQVDFHAWVLNLLVLTDRCTCGTAVPEKLVPDSQCSSTCTGEKSNTAGRRFHLAHYYSIALFLK